MTFSQFLNEVWVFFVGTPKDGDMNPPFLLRYRSSTTFIVLTVCIAIFTDILFYGLIVPVIPFSLSVQAGVPEDQLQQWTTILLACYNAALFVGSPLVGLYADATSSRRLPLLLGLLALAASTVLLCLGRSVGLLVVGRLLQGLSAGIVWSVGFALLADTLGRNIGTSMGYVSIAMDIGLLISPTIGGAVYEAAGYYAVYYIAFGVVFCDILARLLLIEKKVARRWIQDDDHDAPKTKRQAGQTEGVTESVEGTSQTATQPGTNESAVVPSVQPPGPVEENRTRNPYLKLIRSKRILGALLGVILQAGGIFACDTVLPLFVKETFHWNSTAAGLIFICIMVPGFIAPLVGKWADRRGARWPSTLGFLLSVPPMVCLRLVTDDTIHDKVVLCVLLSLLGTTFTFVAVPLMAEISYAIDDEEVKNPGVWGERGVYGIGYGLFTTAFALGGTIGSLMSGYLHAGPGWATMTWVLALWLGVGAFVVFFTVGGQPPKAPAVSEDERSIGNEGAEHSHSNAA